MAVRVGSGVSESLDPLKEAAVFKNNVLRVRVRVARRQGQKWVPEKE